MDDYSKHPINKALKKKDKLYLYEQMCQIRRFEQASLKLYNQGEIGGFLHLYIGQEAVAVGCVSLCGDDDHLITAYRDHGHALAVGMTSNECMAELLGKATGCSKGKGGSMHFFAPDKNYWGGHGIVAGQTPLGLGLGFALKYQEKDGCALVFLGDGATNQGVFHETLNLAALFDIPVVFIIENNGYSMGTSLERSSAMIDLEKRADAYGMASHSLKGDNIYEVRAGVDAAMQRAKKESKPTLLEIQTYRYYGHSIADANHKKYRSPEEIEEYKANHDPLRVWSAQLLSEEEITQEELDAIDKKMKDEMTAAVKFAKSSPAPTLESIYEDVYSEIDDGNPVRGSHFFNLN